MREKIYRFMYGRYGQNGPDGLYRFLVGAALVCVIANIFLNSNILSYIACISQVFLSTDGTQGKYIPFKTKIREFASISLDGICRKVYHRIGYVCVVAICCGHDTPWLL